MRVRPDNILDTAEALFGERGCDGTSTRVIAEAAGVNIAMLSYYFGSKEGLLEALVQRRCQALETAINQTISEVTPPEDRLRRFLTVCARFLMQQHPAFLALLVRESTAAVPGARAASLGRLTLPVRRTLDEVLEAGNGGTGRVGADLCFSLMLGVFAAASVSPPFASPAVTASVEWLVEAVLRAVEADDSGYVRTNSESPGPGRPGAPTAIQADSFEIGVVD